MRSAALLLVPAAVGCASINPTLTPARVLARGLVGADVGSGYVAPVVDSSLTAASAAAQRVAAGTVSEADRGSLERAAMAWGATPSGLAPYVAVRVGLGADSEAHVAMIGRAVRLGARHIVWTGGEDWALSVGVQARGAFWGDPFGSAVPLLTVDSARLLGGDANIVLGRTTSRLYDLWLGLRAGYTRGDSQVRFGASTGINGGDAFGVSVDRVDVAGTVGLRVGFGHVSGLLEIEGAFGFFDGRTSTGVNMGGVVFSLVPAAALSWSF